MDSSDDIDYIRVAIELDRDFAIKTILCLRMPMMMVYWIEDGAIKSAVTTRDKAIEIILNKEVVGLS